jgi:hypothetical protein
MTTPTNEFPRETAGLPATSTTATVELADGDRFALRIGPVSKRIGDATVRMLAYNGSIPGATLRVAQGSELLVDDSARVAFPDHPHIRPARPTGSAAKAARTSSHRSSRHQMPIVVGGHRERSGPSPDLRAPVRAP